LTGDHQIQKQIIGILKEYQAGLTGHFDNACASCRPSDGGSDAVACTPYSAGKAGR
jgi:hypothetical protein